jgi:hypothetical protein
MLKKDRQTWGVSLPVGGGESEGHLCPFPLSDAAD